jgi:hypothetical protein
MNEATDCDCGWQSYGATLQACFSSIFGSRAILCWYTMEGRTLRYCHLPLFWFVFATSLKLTLRLWLVLGCPFSKSEFQSKWIAGVLSGRFVLPSPEHMMDDVKAFYSTLVASGIPKHYTHKMLDSGVLSHASNVFVRLFFTWQINFHVLKFKFQKR